MKTTLSFAELNAVSGGSFELEMATGAPADSDSKSSSSSSDSGSRCTNGTCNAMIGVRG